MFIQVISGTVSSDVDAVQSAIERWATELGPEAVGWLGTTAGVTEDGRFIVLARFDSEESARRNSDRPEQGAWWAETAGLLDGEATFRDSSAVMVDVNSDPDAAGFVQVMQGRSSDPARAKELMSQDAEEWAAFRPDVIGSVSVQHDDGFWTSALYFTSEEEARQGEAKETPAHLQAIMSEMESLTVGETDFFDLKHPWLQSPG